MVVAQKITALLEAVEQQPDPRTMSWPLVSGIYPLLALTAGYYAFVYFGPKLMANRPAFQLKYPLIAYNFCLVVMSMWMVKEFAATSLMRPGFSWTCQTIDYSEDPTSMRLANVIWWYYFSKIIEYMDTVFFILRKKNSQVTFLHVYHHSTMPLLWYVGVRYLAGGESYFCAMLNSFIHVLMYGYYFLSAFGPRMQPFLWWKRYITSLQLLQFNMVMLHTAVSIYVNCGYPRFYMVMLILYCLSHVVLFSNFFYQSYIVKARKAKQARLHAANNNEQLASNSGVKVKGVSSSPSGKNGYKRRGLRKEE